MAKKWYGKRGNGKRYYGKKNYKRKSKYSEPEILAYKLGQIQRGLNNPNSKVYESYNNGMQVKQPAPKKPLF